MSSHIVIARKYRPKRFSEVIFQEHITVTLANSIKSGRIAHAYLFGGPRGVGKTSLARIYARCLNCQGGPKQDPCDQCQNCIEIQNGSSLDVIEIDGASNNSVDNIRDLREGARFSPAKSRYKVYIIDEVHMLSSSAFNALLKILEEPPEHIIFILATTELHKIPATILSRCQKYQFRRIPIQQISDSLAQVLKQEKIGASQEALFWIAKQSGGSLRDAQSILEQVMSYAISEAKEGGAKDDASPIISGNLVRQLLGIADFELYNQVFLLMRQESPQSLLKLIDESYQNGLDSNRFIHGLLEFLRLVRLMKHGIDDEQILQIPKSEIANYQALFDLYNDEDIDNLFNLFKAVPNQFRYINDSQVLVEMTLLKAFDYIRQPALSEMLNKLSASLDSLPLNGLLLEGHSLDSNPKKKSENGSDPGRQISTAQTDKIISSDLNPKIPKSQMTDPGLRDPQKDIVYSREAETRSEKVKDDRSSVLQQPSVVGSNELEAQQTELKKSEFEKPILSEADKPTTKQAENNYRAATNQKNSDQKVDIKKHLVEPLTSKDREGADDGLNKMGISEKGGIQDRKQNANDELPVITKAKELFDAVEISDAEKKRMQSLMQHTRKRKPKTAPSK